MNWFKLIPMLISYGPEIEQTAVRIWQQVSNNKDYVDAFEKALPQVAALANEIATIFFPQQAPDVAKVATTALTFNKALIKYAQQACNLLINSGLVVDGIYGPKTRAAVVELQQHLGLTADGIFGKITEAAVKKLAPNLA